MLRLLCTAEETILRKEEDTSPPATQSKGFPTRQNLMGERPKSPGPSRDDVLLRWKLLKASDGDGRVHLGDKYWKFSERRWYDVRDKKTFLGDSVATSMGRFIRRIGK